MQDDQLWNKNTESKFFKESLKSFATPEQLFYNTNENKYLAYWPKGYKGRKNTLQSRNSLIGNFTEKWTRDLIQKAVKDKGLYAISEPESELYAIQGCICNDLGLTNRSAADVAITTTNKKIVEPEDIVAIIEVKMSIVWNWQLKNGPTNELIPVGNYKTHEGNPGLLRSDSMLKAIGKSINIRISSDEASNIPIIIMGNTPITENYYSKVDNLKKAGIIQGFWSVNPDPLENEETIKKTEKEGFYRFDTFEELKNSIEVLLSEERNWFSSMKNKAKLGKIIEIANKEKSYEDKAEIFLKLIKD